MKLYIKMAGTIAHWPIEGRRASQAAQGSQIGKNEKRDKAAKMFENTRFYKGCWKSTEICKVLLTLVSPMPSEPNVFNTFSHLLRLSFSAAGFDRWRRMLWAATGLDRCLHHTDLFAYRHTHIYIHIYKKV